jgi:hypothetical protein
MEQPPVIQAEPAAERKANLGRIGLYFAIAPLAAFAAIVLMRPG